MHQETSKKQKVSPSAYIPENRIQSINTRSSEEGITWSQTLNTLYPAADLRWDSHRMMDMDGEKSELRRGLESYSGWGQGFLTSR